MRYHEIIQEASSKLSIRVMRLDARSIAAVFRDLQNGRWSQTRGPVIVFGTEHNQYQLADGYHRVLQAILTGQTHIRGKRDQSYVERNPVTPDDHLWRFDPSSPTFGLESLGFSEAEIRQTATATHEHQLGYLGNGNV